MAKDDLKIPKIGGEAGELQEHPVMIVRMWSGIILVGYLLGENANEDMVLKSPLTYQVVPQPDGRTAMAMSELAVQGCSDPDNVNGHCAIPKRQMMWGDLADEKLQSVYVDSLTQLKAQKSGISIVPANGMPKLQ